MLSTINGFDLLLVIVIVLLVFKVMRLNDECNDYVRQIMEVSHDNYRLSEQVRNLRYDLETWEPGFTPAFTSNCAYCAGIEDFITGDECICPPF
jgi:hypothetical protein